MRSLHRYTTRVNRHGTLRICDIDLCATEQAYCGLFAGEMISLLYFEYDPEDNTISFLKRGAFLPTWNNSIEEHHAVAISDCTVYMDDKVLQCENGCVVCRRDYQVI